MLSRRQKRAIVGTAGFVLLAAVVLFSIGRFFANRALDRQLAEERAELRAPEPLVVSAKRITVERRRSFSARAEPWSRASLAPEVGGTVVRIGGDVGTRVEAGTELLALDDAAARAAAESARIQADEAARRQRELDRLVRTEAIATTAAAAGSAIAAASARDADRAATLLEKHRLRAPFSGVVQSRQVDVGDYLNPGQSAFELVDVSRLRIVFQAGEREVASFAPGARVNVEFPALHGRTAEAVVRNVAPSSGPSGLFRIEAELANPEGEIPGGLAATVDASVRLYRDAIFIPTAAVRLEGARAVVLRVREGGAPEPVTIEIEPELDGQFPVAHGLDEGDRLLVR